MNEKEIVLPGKIMVSNSDRTCFLYDSSGVVKFKLRDDKESRYSGLKWVHRDHNFIGVEYLYHNGVISKGNVVQFDVNGQITERIFQAQEGEFAGDTFLSNDDSKLMFLLETVGDKKLNPLEGLNRQQSLIIMDFDRRTIIRRIDHFGSSMSINFKESPWISDGTQLVYTVSGDRKLTIDGTDISTVAAGSAGVYLYDLNLNHHKLLVPNGQLAVCSPINWQISYIKDNSIWLMDTKTNTTRLLYTVGPKEKVTNIHWTPDGKNIYLAYFRNPSSKLVTSGETLINVEIGNEIPFKKIGHGFNPYTWK